MRLSGAVFVDFTNPRGFTPHYAGLIGRRRRQTGFGREYVRRNLLCCQPSIAVVAQLRSPHFHTPPRDESPLGALFLSVNQNVAFARGVERNPTVMLRVYDDSVLITGRPVGGDPLA